MVGNGAAELLQAAALMLLDARRRAGHAVAVVPALPADGAARRRPARPGGARLRRRRPRRLRAAVGRAHARRGALQPQRPDGTYLESPTLGELIARAPRARPRAARRGLHPVPGRRGRGRRACGSSTRSRALLVFRTFSKIYGLSGLRAGYAVGSTASGDAARPRSRPCSASTRSPRRASSQALQIGDREIERRSELVVEQRARLLHALHDLPVDAPESQANFVWLQRAGLTGAELTARLERDRRARGARRPARRRRPRARGRSAARRRASGCSRRSASVTAERR